MHICRAAARVLPSVGVSSWSLRCTRSLVEVGVCDAVARHAWYVYLHIGYARRDARDANGMLVFNMPPEGYPAGKDKDVMPGLDYDATNVLVEVIINHDVGNLHMRVDGAAPVEVFTGFPAGAALRPFVASYKYGTSASFVRPYYI